MDSIKFTVDEIRSFKGYENLTNEEVRVRMKAMGLDLDKQRWSSIFRNIFYAGYFAHPFLHGEVIKGPHEPLVSLDDFLKVNEAFEGWLETLSVPHRELLEAQLTRALPVLNKNSQDEVVSIKMNLTKKENEIERIEYNLATAPTPKIQETCSRMLVKAEAE